MLYQRLEEAALNAWPALEQVLFDGWVVRWANGYTKRANSVTPLYAGHLPLVEKVACCEQFYATRGQPAMFRLTSGADMLDLDARLAQRGYALVEPSLVLHRAVQAADLSRPAARAVHSPLDVWLTTFCQLSGVQPADAGQQTHRAILQAIPGRCLFLTLAEAGVTVACGMGVVEQAYVGLFNLVTAAAYRQQGYAMVLVAELLHQAGQQGAQHAYLQVTEQNSAARRLYARAGFGAAYRYWYRVAS